MEEITTIILGSFVSLITHFAKKLKIANPLVLVAVVSVIAGFAYNLAVTGGVVTEGVVKYATVSFAYAVAVYNVLKQLKK